MHSIPVTNVTVVIDLVTNVTVVIDLVTNVTVVIDLVCILFLLQMLRSLSI
jgi:hypothetical protein